MLGRHPTLKGGKEQVGGNAPQDTANDEDRKVGRVLHGVDNDFENAVDDTTPFPPKLVHGTAQEGGKNGPAEKAG